MQLRHPTADASLYSFRRRQLVSRYARRLLPVGNRKRPGSISSFGRLVLDVGSFFSCGGQLVPPAQRRTAGDVLESGKQHRGLRCLPHASEPARVQSEWDLLHDTGMIRSRLLEPRHTPAESCGDERRCGWDKHERERRRLTAEGGARPRPCRHLIDRAVDHAVQPRLSKYAASSMIVIVPSATSAVTAPSVALPYANAVTASASLSRMASSQIPA